MAPRQAPRARDPRPRGSLDRRTVAATAIEVIEEHGIDSLTMRALASELDCGTMTLYSHVRNRDDLIVAILERLIEELDVVAHTSHADDGWRDVLVRLFGAYRELAERHPHAFELLALAPYDAEPVASHLESVLASLERAGLSPDDARRVLGISDAFATGFLVVRARTTTRPGTVAGASTPLEDLRSVVMYERGIEAILAGIEGTLTGVTTDHRSST